MAIVGIASFMGLMNPHAVMAAATFNVLHSFDNTNGATPTRGVTQGSDGSFYGTTYNGGQFNRGTVYKLDANSNFSVVHNFADDHTDLPWDGGEPDSGITIDANGSLVGATTVSTLDFRARVFKIDINGAFRFFGGAFGYHVFPNGQLALGSDSSLYGTADGDNNFGAGLVYKIEPSGNFSTLHVFNGCYVCPGREDGKSPREGVTLDINGNLYGTTSDGGSLGTSQGGVVFKIAASGVYSILRSFDDPTYGTMPSSRVIVASDGSLYGTTLLGGSLDFGVMYKIDPSGVYSVLHNFDNTTGGKPTDIINIKDGSFYGTTTVGGQFGFGTVFKLDPSGIYSVLHDFDNTGGAEPNGISFGRDGNLYGTTAKGGQFGFGTIFSVDFGPANAAPVATNDAFMLKVHKNNPVTVAAPGVLGNDADADGNKLTIVGATATTPRNITLPGGTVELYADGHFVYTPSKDKKMFNGTSSFTYQATDGLATNNTAIVVLAITPAAKDPKHGDDHNKHGKHGKHGKRGH